jgi:hypothetical protein
MTDMRDKLRALWRGDEPLGRVFWLYYAVVVAVLQGLGAVMGGLGGLFHVAALGWAAFMVRPVMTAAERYKGPKHWGFLAKVAAVMITIAVIAQLAAS